MAKKWQRDLTFSERLAETSKMHVSASLAAPELLCDSSAAYKAVHPHCTPQEASRYAKASEEAIRKRANSLVAASDLPIFGFLVDKEQQEYYEGCVGAARSLRDSPAQDDGAGDHIATQTQRDPTAAGVKMGRYVNAQHFTDGLFSEIFKAVLPQGKDDGQASTVVALKMTIPSTMHAPHDAEREARILLSCHSDRVIRLLDTFKQPGGRFVLAFPFMPLDLDVLLKRRELTGQARRSILRDMLSGLDHIHGLGVIHRDIKPSNILLSSPTGPACIADFGIAWSPLDAAAEPINEKITDVGTTCYRPPELLFGNAAYGTPLDLWATGCVAAQVICLDGKTLFDAGDLGSELALIKSIFEKLGTPDLDVWPEAAAFPDWGKMNFRDYPGQAWEQIMPGAELDALDLVGRLVTYESSRRLRAGEALYHPYLSRSET